MPNVCKLHKHYQKTSQLSRFHRVSHGFTTFLTVSRQVLHFSQLYKFQVDFLSNSQFPKKTNQATEPFVKKYCSSSSTYKKIHNSVIFDSETSTRSSPGNDYPVNHQNFYEKHLSSISLTERDLFRDSFCKILELLSKMPMLECFY